MLEEKVKELLKIKEVIAEVTEDKKLAHEQFNINLLALPGYSELMEKHKLEDEQLAGRLLEEISLKDALEGEVLNEMTEKTYQVGNVKITKAWIRKVVVNNPMAFFRYLERNAAGMLSKVKFSFPGGDIIKANDMGMLKLSHETAQITAKPSLRITIKK